MKKINSGRIKEKLEGKTGSRGFCGLSLLFLGCVCKLSAKGKAYEDDLIMQLHYQECNRKYKVWRFDVHLAEYAC